MDTSPYSMPVEVIMPAIIGAIATITAAMLQLASSWRKEIGSREAYNPTNKRRRRGMVGAVVVLMIASAFGGFSFSQYLVRDALELDRETRARLDQLTIIAERLERTSQQPTTHATPAAAPAAAVTPPTPAALPTPTCLEGNPPVEKPCAEPQRLETRASELPIVATPVSSAQDSATAGVH